MAKIPVQQEEIPKEVTEIAEMIENLIGKPLNQWTSTLPTYFGLDTRNNQNMYVIKYCGEKQCPVENYSLFLIYVKVSLEQCAELAGQPLVNPKTNEFIGCEPGIQKHKSEKTN